MIPSLDTDLLRTFVAIVDNGSFTQAARLVHRTQSAVSMQVKKLEEAVGKSLFQRDGRSVSLTAEGELLLHYARRILRLHEEAIATFTQPEMVGTVRIGTPDDYAARFLPGVLAAFARSYPRVQVAVRCEPSRNLTVALEKDELDLALVTCHPGTESGEILRWERAVWATSERHCSHEEDPVPLAVFDETCVFRIWAQKALDGVGKSYRIAYSSPSISGILAAVTAGLATTVLARSILPPGVRELRPEEGFPELPMVAIALHRAPGKRSRAIDCLADYLVDGFRGDEVQAA